MSSNPYIQYLTNMKPVLFLMAASALLFLAFIPFNGTSASHGAGDCDDNAIIRCGSHSTGELANDYAALDAKGKSAFTYAGVDPSKFGKAVLGSVTRDNKVIVNGKVVATGVYTYGRQNIAGSQQMGSGVFKRQPSVSFRSSSIPAFVYMDGGVFKWAVITTCGNPVHGTPTANPKITINKKVSKPVVQPDEIFNYTITVKNTGNIELRNVVVKDLLPKGLVRANGQQGRQFEFHLGTMTPGQTKNITFKVKALESAPRGVPLVNLACVNTNQNPQFPICDDVPVKVPPKKSVKCVDLSADSVDRLTRKFSVTTEVRNGGKITGYVFDFGDGEKVTRQNPTAKHTYKPGSYVAKVTLKTNLGDKTSKACELPIKIAKQDEPALDIEKKVTDDLTLAANQAGFDAAKELVEVDPETVVKFIIKFTNIGNIALEDVLIKDILPAGLSLEEGELDRTIQKIEPGESMYFELTARAGADIGNDTVTNVVCAAHDTNGDGKTDINDCSRENCPKNPDIPAGSDLEDCDDAKVRIRVPGTPSTLPKTGPLSFISGVGSLALVIAAARSWFNSRRALALAHLNK